MNDRRHREAEDGSGVPPAAKGRLHVVAPVGFEGLRLGQSFALPSRSLTSAHFAAFQAVSGDNHPIHYDTEYCRERGHRDLLAHGLLVSCFAASGAGLFPHLVGDALVGFLDQECAFRAPAYRGDTLTTVLEVAELKRQRTTGVVTLSVEIRNQSGALVLEGRQRYLLRLQHGAATPGAGGRS